ncbi:MAG: hypothetical protein L0H25_05975 [Micrococcales bacterium]|nr:hypothetical protein [Micrococcales bacterium]
MGWVDGEPKVVSQRYLGTAAEIEVLLEGREKAMPPVRPGLGTYLTLVTASGW